MAGGDRDEETAGDFIDEKGDYETVNFSHRPERSSGNSKS
jgi:hypothetical protein